MRRWPLLFLTSLGIGCGLAFAPGDYGSAAAKPAADGGAPSGTLPDAAKGPADSAPAPAPAHLLVITGDGADGGVPTSDVWTATFDDAGNVGAFVYNAPNPIPGPVSAAAIVGDTLLLSTFAAGNRVVETPAWDGGVVATGSGSAQIANTSSPPGYAQFFAERTLVSIGGVYVTSDVFGNTSYDYDAGIWVSVPDGGTYGDAGLSPATAPAGFQDVRVAVAGSFVYLSGRDGTSDPAQSSRVYVGALDPGAGVTNARPTTTMTVDDGGPYEPLRPMFCAGDGYLFVAGGQAADDVTVRYAPINEADGTLGAWKTGPNLPATLYQAGCVVHDHALYLVGGWSGETPADGGRGAASDRILRWSVASGGWESAGQLPSPRSNILALIY